MLQKLVLDSWLLNGNDADKKICKQLERTGFYFKISANKTNHNSCNRNDYDKKSAFTCKGHSSSIDW